VSAAKIKRPTDGYFFFPPHREALFFSQKQPEPPFDPPHSSVITARSPPLCPGGPLGRFPCFLLSAPGLFIQRVLILPTYLLSLAERRSVPWDSLERILPYQGRPSLAARSRSLVLSAVSAVVESVQGHLFPHPRRRPLPVAVCPSSLTKLSTSHIITRKNACVPVSQFGVGRVCFRKAFRYPRSKRDHPASIGLIPQITIDRLSM